LLANRIALLKAEEKKAWKKIEDTKKKATDVQKVKVRNYEKEKEKADRENKKAREREL